MCQETSGASKPLLLRPYLSRSPHSPEMSGAILTKVPKYLVIEYDTYGYCICCNVTFFERALWFSHPCLHVQALIEVEALGTELPLPSRRKLLSLIY